MKSNTFTLTFYVIVLISLFFYGCAKEPLIYYHTPEPAEPEQLEIFPKTVFVGHYIVIIGYESKEYYGIYPKIIFPDSIICFSDISKNDSLYTYVPFGTKSGEVRVISNGYEGVTDPLTVINECETGVCVETWNLNYQITEELSWTTNVTGYPFSWTVEIKSDTVCLRQDGDGPNEEWHKGLCLRSRNHNSLPEFISGYYHSHPGGGFSIESGIIKIYEWDLNGIISGKVFFNPSMHWPKDFVFWVNLSDSSFYQ